MKDRSPEAESPRLISLGVPKNKATFASLSCGNFTEPELKNRFLGFSAFSRGGDRQSQIRKKNIGVARFHRLRLFTWALIEADCHHSSTHGTHKKYKK